MATNQQNQHISTFIKGMDTDTSDMLLESDKYRYAENVRIVTNTESNSGEIRLVEGCYPNIFIDDIIDVYNQTVTEDDSYILSDKKSIQEEIDDLNAQLGKITALISNYSLIVTLDQTRLTEVEQLINAWPDFSTVDPEDYFNYDDYSWYQGNITLVQSAIITTQDRLDNDETLTPAERESLVEYLEHLREELEDLQQKQALVVLDAEDNYNVGLNILLSTYNMLDQLINVLTEQIGILQTGQLNLTSQIEELQEYLDLYDDTAAKERRKVPYSESGYPDWYIRESTSIRDYGVLIIENKVSNEWFVVRYTNLNEDITLIFGKCEEPLSQENKLSLTCNYEDEHNVKLYIADGEHEILIINLFPDVIYNRIDQLINYSSQFRPSEPYDLELIDGSLKCGTVSYCYQYYNPQSTASQVSAISKEIAINMYGNTYPTRGGRLDQTGTCGVLFKINLSTDYLKLKVYRILSTIGGYASSILLIIDSYYGGSTGYIQIEDPGLNALEELSISDLNSDINVHLIPKIIESKNNRLFASNIKTKHELSFIDWDARAFSIGDKYNDLYILSTRPYSSGRITGEIVTDILDDVELNKLADVKNENLDFSNAYDYDSWKKIYANINNVVYSINGYGAHISWSYFFEEDDTIDSQIYDHCITRPDYKNEVNNNSDRRSLRRDEVYRYGIILEDKFGYRYPVKWIADIRTPDIYNEPHFITTPSTVVSRKLYIKFLVYDLPDDCKSYEIVRCKLNASDRHNITLGVVSSLIVHPASNNTCPTGLATLNHIIYHELNRPRDREEGYALTHQPFYSRFIHAYGHTTYSNVLFFSPEISYQSDDIRMLLQNETASLNPIQILYPARRVFQSNAVNNITGSGSHEWYGTVSTVDAKPLYYDNYSFTPTTYSKPSILDINDSADHTKSYTLIPFALSRDFNFGSDDEAYCNEHGIDITSKKYVPLYLIKGYSNGLEEIEEIVGSNDGAYYVYSRALDQLMYDKSDDIKHTLSTSYQDGDYTKDMSEFSRTYVKLYNKHTNNHYHTNDNLISILQTSFPDVPQWNEFVAQDLLLYKQKQYPIGGKTYIPFSFPQGWCYLGFHPYSTSYTVSDEWGADSRSTSVKRSLFNDDEPTMYADLERRSSSFAVLPVSAAGKSIILQLNTGNIHNGGSFDVCYCGTDNNLAGATVLCNITRNVQPYGGYNYSNRVNSIYSSFGNIVINPDKNLTSIISYDGDCFIQCFEFMPAHKVYSAAVPYLRTFSTVYSVPVETDIDIRNDYGWTLSSKSDPNSSWHWFTQHKAGSFNNWYLQDLDLFGYNTAYSFRPYQSDYTSVSDADQNLFLNIDTRTYFSELKAANEVVDSWTTFKTLNYLDVDTKYGAITDLKTFNNQLIYWQERATGVFSVNEKQLLENTDGTNLILGTGDVLQRYDYLSTEYGMKPNHMAKVLSDTGLYWWDENKLEILAYKNSKDVIPTKGVIKLGTTKSVKNYLLNLSTNDNPILSYDNQNDEIVFTVGNNESVVYNELLDVFTSIYKISPTNKVLFKDCLLVLDNQRVYKWNNSQYDGDDVYRSYGFYTGTGRIIQQEELHPLIQAVVNTASTQTKTFDNISFGGRFYGGGDAELMKTPNTYQIQKKRNLGGLTNLRFVFKTPTKQVGEINEDNIANHMTNIEYDFKMSLPRSGETGSSNGYYGDRLKGKFMSMLLSSISNELDFSLQYIITKYRASWN